LHYTENPDAEIFKISDVNTKTLQKGSQYPDLIKKKKKKRFSSIPRLRKRIKSVDFDGLQRRKTGNILKRR
jgi:hypothetical protein